MSGAGGGGVEENEPRAATNLWCRKYQQNSYAVGGVCSTLYNLRLAAYRVSRLTEMVSTDAKLKHELHLSDVLSLTNAVKSCYTRTQHVCTQFEMIVKLNVLYSFVSLVMVSTAVLHYYVASDSDRLLVPAWTVTILFGGLLSFLVQITFVAYINICLQKLNNVLSHYHVTIVMLRAEKSHTQERKEELVIMSDLVSTLLRLDSNVANFLGLPITTRLITVLWGNAGERRDRRERANPPPI